jgi:hypothetical protein
MLAAETLIRGQISIQIDQETAEISCLEKESKSLQKYNITETVKKFHFAKMAKIIN